MKKSMRTLLLALVLMHAAGPAWPSLAPEALDRTLERTQVLVRAQIMQVIYQYPEQHPDRPRMGDGPPPRYTVELKVMESYPEIDDAHIRLSTILCKKAEERDAIRMDPHALFRDRIFGSAPDQPVEAIVALARTADGWKHVPDIYFSYYGVYPISPNGNVVLPDVGRDIPYNLAWTLLCDLLDYYDEKDTSEASLRWTRHLVSTVPVEARAARRYIEIAEGGTARSVSSQEVQQALDRLISGAIGEARTALEFFLRLDPLELSPDIVVDRLEREYHALERPKPNHRPAPLPDAWQMFHVFSISAMEVLLHIADPDAVTRVYDLYVADSQQRQLERCPQPNLRHYECSEAISFATNRRYFACPPPMPVTRCFPIAPLPG